MSGDEIIELHEASKLAASFLRDDGWYNAAERLETAVEAVSLPMTLVGCSRCKRGYPLRYLAGGMCAGCLFEELKARPQWAAEA